MDYSLIVGIHDCERTEPEGPDINPPNTDSDEPVSGDDENGYEYEENVPDIGGFAPTPPDSPQPNNLPAFNGDIDPNIEKFGVKCAEGNDNITHSALVLLVILCKNYSIRFLLGVCKKKTTQKKPILLIW